MSVVPAGAVDHALALLFPPKTDDRDQASACTTSLRTFVEEAWPIVEPGTTFKTNWHIDAICDHLQAVSDGHIKRLIINIPPRHMKSSTVAVLWPVWEWLTRPETRFLYASYAQGLSKRDSLKCRRIIESMGGRRQGGNLIERIGYTGFLHLIGQDWKLAGDQNEKLRFENTRAGYRIATSVGGSATGEGGDIIVIDDPHKADEIESVTQRDKVTEWLDGTMSTRHNDPSTGRTVLVMQRLHQGDATGHLLAQGGWEHLCLPARYEPKHPYIWPDDPRSTPGELLWPDHFDESAVTSLEKSLLSRAPGQLQQNPVALEGGMFKRHWWQRRWQPGFESTLPLGFDAVIQSWDMRFSDSKEKTSSYVVGQVLGYHGADVYLLAQCRGRLSFTETLHAVKALSEFRPESTAKLVEKKANGEAVISTLRRKVPGLIGIEPLGGKDVRAAAVSHFIEAGNVILPASDTIPCPSHFVDEAGQRVDLVPTTVADFIEEFATFPKAMNDDQVDALSQALSWRAPAARAAVVDDDEDEEPEALTAGLMDRPI